MKKFARPIKTIAIALSTYLLLYTGYTAFSAEKYGFEYPNAGYLYVKNQYHLLMKEYFDDKIALFLKMSLDDPNYSPPKEDEECSPKNVSTYCVAMGALDMYETYLDTLDDVTAMFLTTGGAEIDDLTVPVLGNPTGMIADTFQWITNVEDDVEREKENALQVMELTVDAYNELRLALPMHKKYEQVLVDLTNYRDILSDIKLKTQRFPVKFIDATSQSCK